MPAFSDAAGIMRRRIAAAEAVLPAAEPGAVDIAAVQRRLAAQRQHLRTAHQQSMGGLGSHGSGGRGRPGPAGLNPGPSAAELVAAELATLRQLRRRLLGGGSAGVRGRASGGGTVGSGAIRAMRPGFSGGGRGAAGAVKAARPVDATRNRPRGGGGGSGAPPSAPKGSGPKGNGSKGPKAIAAGPRAPGYGGPREGRGAKQKSARWGAAARLGPAAGMRLARMGHCSARA